MMSYIKPHARRKGFSITETIILMVVLLITIGAIFSTAYWAQKTYAFSKQDRDSREVLLSWAETFDMMWPTQEYVSSDVTWKAEAGNSIKDVGNMLGNMLAYSDDIYIARIGGFLVEAILPSAVSADKIDVRIVIRGEQKTYVDLTRSFSSFNTFINDTVSDDSIQEGA